MRNVKDKKQFNFKKLLTIVFVIILIISLTYISIYALRKINHKNSIDKISDTSLVDVYTAKDDETKNTVITEAMKRIADMQLENSDIKGWINIENTIIDFPLLQTDDNDFYLEHNYKKEYDYYGSSYINKDVSLSNQSDNIIIYGHNKGDGLMFGELLNYKDPNYLEDHRKLIIATESEIKEYEVIAAFYSRIYYKDEKDVFRYYSYLDLSDSNYDEYLNNVRENAVFYEDSNENERGQILTLVTCEYSQSNGRFVVIAKQKIKN